MSHSGKTIRFEDLGEPVQRLLKSIKGGVSDEDMALLEFVSVKDMAKIYGEMSTDRQAKEIWEELRGALQARRDKAERKRHELDTRAEELEDQRLREEEAARAAEEQERLDREAEEEARRARKEDRRRRRAEAEAAAQAEEDAAAAAEQEAREEEERLAAEEADRKRREAKRKKREARARELAEEQEALAAEQARTAKKKAGNQKKEWAEYVAQHPLDFPDGGAQSIEQVTVEHSLKPPPKITDELLNRTYTPKCPSCSAKFSKPPNDWDCPLCLKRLKTRVKVWQPDDDSETCMVCKGSIGRFSRHHCRNCGRLVCNKCCEHKALIPQIGYKDPVKVCNDCAGVGTPSA